MRWVSGATAVISIANRSAERRRNWEGVAAKPRRRTGSGVKVARPAGRARREFEPKSIFAKSKARLGLGR